MTGVSQKNQDGEEAVRDKKFFGGIIMAKQYPLNAATPHSYTYAVRNLPEVTVEQALDGDNPPQE